jgi:hypothetical protein
MRELYKFRNRGCYCGHKRTWASGRQNIKISPKGTKHLSKIGIKNGLMKTAKNYLKTI